MIKLSFWNKYYGKIKLDPYTFIQVTIFICIIGCVVCFCIMMWEESQVQSRSVFPSTSLNLCNFIVRLIHAEILSVVQQFFCMRSHIELYFSMRRTPSAKSLCYLSVWDYDYSHTCRHWVIFLCIIWEESWVRSQSVFTCAIFLILCFHIDYVSMSNIHISNIYLLNPNYTVKAKMIDFSTSAIWDS